MTVLIAILTEVAKHLRRWLRAVAYDDMARQASGWVPDEARIEKQAHNKQPIKLDFEIPKQHRLNWSHRTIQQLPH
jgi:hypothetical protein